ncbi:hypothetical protein DJ71_23280, partial [Halorubrum sp. E3]
MRKVRRGRSGPTELPGPIAYPGALETATRVLQYARSPAAARTVPRRRPRLRLRRGAVLRR